MYTSGCDLNYKDYSVLDAYLCIYAFIFVEFYCTTKFIFDLENEDLWLHVEFWTLGGIGEHVDDKFAVHSLIVKIINHHLLSDHHDDCLLSNV